VRLRDYVSVVNSLVANDPAKHRAVASDTPDRS
jgi:hypothetical protein